MDLSSFNQQQLAILAHQNAHISFSSYGEDLVLQNFFSRRNKPGFYVDIGANHPFSHSNTYLFYILNWTGINVEPTPDLYNTLVQARPLDINVNALIGRETGEVRKFQMHPRHGENGMISDGVEYAEQVEEAINDYWGMTQAKEDRINQIIELRTTRLDDLLATYEDRFESIEFMNVDVEGFELEVLQSNDWNRFRPKIVLLEDYLFDVDKMEENPLHKYIEDQGYKFLCRQMITNLYVRSDVTRDTV